MGKMIAMCGLACDDCPAFVATLKNDNMEKERVAKMWSSKEFPLKAEDISCEGCATVRGKLMKFCDTCQVRQCGMERNVSNCAYCGEYPCDKLNNLWKMLGAEQAKKNLDMIWDEMHK
jgi:hypothetical protein